MNLQPILLPPSTRRKYKLGLLSLTKDNLRLVMGFLERVGWRSALSPVPFAMLEVHNPSFTFLFI
jgi:hypothetical protein